MPQVSRHAFGRRSFDVPRVVWALVALFTLTLYAYSQLVPLFFSQDELEHTDLAGAVGDLSDWPDREESIFDERWEEARDSHRVRRRVENAVPRADRPSLDDVAAPGPGDELGVNNAYQHPPLYYTVVGTTVTALVPFTGDWSWMGLMSFMRLLNVLMMAPVPLLAAAAGMRLTGRHDVAVTAALLPFVYPGVAHIGGAVNNDNLLVPLVAALTLVLCHVLTGDTSRRTALIVGFLAMAAGLTKASGLFTIGWIGLAYLFAAWDAPTGTRARVLRRGAIGVAIPVVGAGAWYVRNLVELGTIQPRRVWPDPAPDFEPDVVTFLTRVPRRFAESAWDNFIGGGPGLQLGLLLAVLLGVGVVLAVARAGSTRQRVRYLVLLGGFLGLFGALSYGIWTLYSTKGLLRAMQGRYLYPTVAAVGVLAATGLRSSRAPWASAWSLFALGVVTHVYVLLDFLLPRYWGPEESTLGPRIQAVLAWSAWPVAVNLLLALAWVATIGLTARELAHASRGVDAQATIA